MARLRPENLLSKREEGRFVEAGRRFLVDGGYPNPDRVGCPGSEVLKALASRKVDIREAENSILHVGICSPCFCEYTEFRKQVERRRSAVYIGIAAVVVFILSVALWRWQSSHRPVITDHHYIVADLRNRLTLRGEQGNEPGRTPLVFERGIDEVAFYLPDGSRRGAYEVAVLREELGEPLARANGVSIIQNGITTINAQLDVLRVPTGHYLLGIRPAGMDWSYYPLLVK